MKETRNNFLEAGKCGVFTAASKKDRIHPMDIICQVLKTSEPESARILTENLDKMKYALPFVFPSYFEKSKIRIWPLVGINRQTINRKFNMFEDSHHVIACVRIGQSDGLINKD